MEVNELVVLQRAIEEFGRQEQIDMAIEECAELINALEKLRRNRVGPIDVITEIADVQIMTTQLAYMFGEKEVAAERARKVERLKGRIERHKGNRD